MGKARVIEGYLKNPGYFKTSFNKIGKQILQMPSHRA